MKKIIMGLALLCLLHGVAASGFKTVDEIIFGVVTDAYWMENVSYHPDFSSIIIRFKPEEKREPAIWEVAFDKSEAQILCSFCNELVTNSQKLAEYRKSCEDYSRRIPGQVTPSQMWETYKASHSLVLAPSK